MAELQSASSANEVKKDKSPSLEKKGSDVSQVATKEIKTSDWEGFRPPLGHVEDKARKKARSYLTGLDRGFVIGEDEATRYHLRVSMLMVFNGVVDYDSYAERLDRWTTQYPIFRKKVQDRYAFMQKWEDAKNFNVKDHLQLITLPAPGGDEELQALLTKLQDQPYDFNKPLWGHVIIHGYKGKSLTEVSARKKHKNSDKRKEKLETEHSMVWVSCHHCIGDGTSLGYAISGLLDQYYTHKNPKGPEESKEAERGEEEDTLGDLPVRAEKHRKKNLPLASGSFTSLSQSHTHAWKQRKVPKAPAPPPKQALRRNSILQRRRGSLSTMLQEAKEYLKDVQSPAVNKDEEYDEGFILGDDDKSAQDIDPSSFKAIEYVLVDFAQVLKSFVQVLMVGLFVLWWLPRVMAKVMYISNTPKKLLLEKPQESKEVAWSAHIPLEEAKAIGNSSIFGIKTTVNDVLTSTLTGAFRRCLDEDGVSLAEDTLRIGIPYNLRAPWDTEIGNKMGSLWMYLPIGISDPVERVKAVKKQMDALKKSAEPLISYAVVQAVGRLPAPLASSFANTCKNTLHGLMTNVRGPDVKCSLLGNQLVRACVFIPHTGNGGVGLTIMSYNGELTVTVHRDAYKSVSGSQLMRNFNLEYQHLKSLALAAPTIKT